ncbi:hypothetical protein DL98DRAFT_174651 [Cadophora sp. DSE1049]|nr:hypothetical protein DL98DRAFT_174651 [Cadophora sp. DSE1049]
MPSPTPQRPTYLTISTSTSSPPPSETEIYSVAKVAYSKLVSEASLKDQNLRRLVGHANLYDKLLDEYNNCFSDEESETESWDGDVEDGDVQEFATQAYYTPGTPRKLGGKNEVEIHEEGTYVYQDREQQRGRQMGLGEGVIEEAVLCKVASHSEGLNMGFHALGGYAEVEVKELEVFDE